MCLPVISSVTSIPRIRLIGVQSFFNFHSFKGTQWGLGGLNGHMKFNFIQLNKFLTYHFIFNNHIDLNKLNVNSARQIQNIMLKPTQVHP